jgi:hypothetical protein
MTEGALSSAYRFDQSHTVEQLADAIERGDHLGAGGKG